MIHHRRAGRVILLDASNRLLLLQGHDPSLRTSRWWFTPGGGAEEDETQRQAALRELYEETGLALNEVEGPIWIRHASFDFNGDHYEQSEEFFVARIDTHEVQTSGWTQLEVETVLNVRWWTIEELHETDELIFPSGLGQLALDLIENGIPAEPLELTPQQ